MNLAQAAPGWLVGLLMLLLVAAAIEDALRLRISNMTCLGVLITACIAMAFAGFPAALWQNVLGFAAVLAVGTLLFGSGRIGGGDVKLLAAVALWLSLLGLLWLVVAVSIAGGMLALGYIAARPLRRRAGGPDEQRKSPNIPYGLAIVAGAFLVFAVQALDSNAAKRDPLATLPLPK